jgi:polyhydroxyalkanoate synthesis regulator phasin
MNKTEAIKKINKLIDDLIIEGKKNTAEFKRLCKLHKQLISK